MMQTICFVYYQNVSIKYFISKQYLCINDIELSVDIQGIYGEISYFIKKFYSFLASELTKVKNLNI